ncbi:MAG: class I SAM-dependent methyltransferase [Clostridiales bacterium]|jgi:SAM-dependent methyltransferase|nr:class I SAM-dependent methyltransferase [Clostridiales bacterium]
MEYSALYKYYDGLMSDYPYRKMFGFAVAKLRAANAEKGFEFACGTGVMTAMLAAEGFRLAASDISTDMLNIASEKVLKFGADSPDTATGKTLIFRENAVFLRMDVNKPVLNGKYDFIVSFTDGFNYVSSLTRLDKLFKMCADALSAGGILLFDMSTPHKARTLLSGRLRFEDGGELTVFWENSKFGEKSRKIDMRLTFFEKKVNGAASGKGEIYERCDERNAQYFYETRDVGLLLKKHGFKVEIFNENLKKYTSKAKRLVVCAKKT